VFTPAANASGAGYASFTFQVQDDDGIANGGADTDAIARAMSIDVLPVNDAPGESVPGAQRVTQGGSLVFSTSDANAISISDIDAGANALQVTLATTGGWIKLASIAGLTFTAGTGQHDSLVTFSGSIPSVNAALDGMTFMAAPDAVGSTSISIEVNDLGNSGAGAAQVVSSQLAIDIVSTAVPGAGSSPTPAPVALPPAFPSAGVQTIPPLSAGTPVQQQTPDGPMGSGTPERLASNDSIIASQALGSTADAAPTPAVRVSVQSLQSGQTTREYRVLTAVLPELRQLFFDAAEMPDSGIALTSANAALSTTTALRAMQSTEMLQALDQMRESLHEQSAWDATAVAALAATSLGLSVGYVLWLLRGGVLLSSLLSSLPAWRLVDPLPILGRLDDEDDEDDEQDEDDSLEALVSPKNTTRSSDGSHAAGSRTETP
jgi:hypothetical protein